MSLLPRALLLAALAAPAAHAQSGLPPPAPQHEQPRYGPRSQTPYAAPWEKALRRFYGRESARPLPHPYAEADRRLQRFFDDPIRRLGLPRNVLPEPPPGVLRPPPAPPLPSDVAALDRNDDGVVTRSEYMDDRIRYRGVAAGPAAEARRRSFTGRLRARFDGADRNRDGRLTADELRGVIDPRF